MLDSVNQDDLIVIEALVDDAVVAAAGGLETVEFADERYPEPLRILNKWAEDGLEGSVSNLVGQSVEMAQAFRCDLGRSTAVRSPVFDTSRPDVRRRAVCSGGAGRLCR